MQDKKDSAAQGQGDPVFENKNKAYGAYQLRKSYEKRLTAGLLSTVGLFVLGLLGIMNLGYSPIPEITTGPRGGDPSFDTNIFVLSENPEIIADEQQETGKGSTIEVVKHEVPDADTNQNKKTALNHVAGTVSGRGQGNFSGNPGGGVLKFKAPLLRKKHETVFDTVYDSPPSFPGGRSAYEAYVNAHMRYPMEGMFTPTGRIMLSLSIDEEGNVVNVKVVRGIGYGFDEEAVRVIRSMPKWNPAKTNGRAVAVKCGTTIVIQR